MTIGDDGGDRVAVAELSRMYRFRTDLRHAASVVIELRRKQKLPVFAGLVWCPQADILGEKPSWLQTNRNNQGSLQYNIGGRS